MSLAICAQRYPALARALANGLHVRVAPGVVARLAFHVDEQRGIVTVPVSLPQSTFDTPIGAIHVSGDARVSMSIEDFARALQLAERSGNMPRIEALIAKAQSGRPLLNLPR